MKKLKTNKGVEFIVDDDVFPLVSKYTWNLNHKGYVRSEMKTKQVMIHRLVMNVKDSKIQVDHIKGDKLDNRRSQLRICTNQQNQFNRGIGKKNTSGFKDVMWRKDRARWTVRVRINKKTHWGGSFTSKKDAIRSARELFKKLHGEFARMS